MIVQDAFTGNGGLPIVAFFFGIFYEAVGITQPVPTWAGTSSDLIWATHRHFAMANSTHIKRGVGEQCCNCSLRFPSFHPISPRMENAKNVRFVDPKTKSVVYPDPLPLGAVTPSLGTNIPPVGALVVNPLLTLVAWDLRRPFETHVEQWPPTERAKFKQSVTLQSRILLEIRSPRLPWKIEVRPRTPDIYVAVSEVLAAIHAALGSQITPGEWDRFDTAWKRSTVAARALRVQEYEPALQADEMYKHPRRIDSLGEFTQFAGLVPAPQRGPNCLDLKLKRRR